MKLNTEQMEAHAAEFERQWQEEWIPDNDKINPGQSEEDIELVKSCLFIDYMRNVIAGNGQNEINRQPNKNP